jgi:subtilisin-like proprotein convertase family protein
MRPADFLAFDRSHKARRLSAKQKSQAARKAQARKIALDALERRELLAVLPPVTTVGTLPTNPSFSGAGTSSNDSAPSIAINRSNPDQRVAVWTRRDPGNLGGINRAYDSVIQGAFTTNGGQTWTAFNPSRFGQLIDQATLNATPPLDYNVGRDASVGIDRNGNVYVAELQTNTGRDAGVILVHRFQFIGNNLVGQSTASVYEWGAGSGNAGIAKEPILVVDDTLASYTDPDTGASFNNSYSGNVYIAWSTIDPNTNNITNFNPNSILFSASTDGVSFTPPIYLNDGTQFGDQRNAAPRLAVSQGSSRITPGQVTVVWDDFGSDTVSTAAPFPLSRIESDRLQGGLISLFNGQTGIINDAFNPGAGAHIPAVNNYAINVNITDPRVNFISDLNITLGITHPNMNELRIELIPPAGSGLPTLTILNNRVLPSGTDLGAGTGMTGADLGPASANGSLVGAVFDNRALRSIVDTGGGLATTSYFRPEQTGAGSLLNLLQNTPATRAQINGTWTLRITDNRETQNQFARVNALRLQFTGSTENRVTLIPGPDRTVTRTTVIGAADPNYQTTSLASPLGIGPAPTIASDNTTSSYSIYLPNNPANYTTSSGILYIAYVDRFDQRRDGSAAAENPADNTDIRLAVSEDGGVTWTVRRTSVSDDVAAQDGYSEGLISQTYITGRPQFQPQIAVDPVTGTLVLSYFDTRDDAARARPATYIATSLDQGRTFGTQTYVNPPLAPFDGASRTIVNLGPIPTNGRFEPNYSFGLRQGLAVHAGQIAPAFSWNENGGIFGDRSLDIALPRVVTASGPRVVSSTMGPVQPVTVLGTTVNNTEAPDGTPIFDGFFITFDRPIDRRTFTTAQVQVRYRTPDMSPSNPGNLVNVTSVTALNPVAPSGFAGQNWAATTFVVRVTPTSGVGTYSYAIGNNIKDLMGVPVGGVRGQVMDQNANARSGDNPGDFYTAPRLTGPTLFLPTFDSTTLPLMIGGPRVLNALVPGQTDTLDNLVLQAGTNRIRVVFDRSMNPATLETASGANPIIRMVGPRGLITGPFTVARVADTNVPNDTYEITFPPQDQNGTYSIVLAATIRSSRGDALDTNQNAGLDTLRDTLNPTTGATQEVVYTNSIPVALNPGNKITSIITVPDGFTIQDLNLQLNITTPVAALLRGYLVYDPDPTSSADDIRITLFENLRNVSPFANFSDTIFDDQATTLIQNAGAPFRGRFKPIEPLAALVGSAANSSFRLEIETDASSTGGTLNNWLLTFQRAIPINGLGEAIADQATIDFRIFNMDPTSPVSTREWTAVGPASIDATGLGVTGQSAGRVSSIAVDPSDPSGNTVYIGAASGGVWKTTNFLTASPLGPTWIPLTDFGPTFSINISTIATRAINNDPNRTILYVGTGESDGRFDGSVAPNSTRTGVGILFSTNGGATWTILDSLTNVDTFGNILPLSARTNTVFRNAAISKILVDPRPTLTGESIVYVGVSEGPAPGLYRSMNSGRNFTLLHAGSVTDISFDPFSGPISVSNPNGNLQRLYIAFAGEGVYISENQGVVRTLLTGGQGKPLVRDFDNPPPQTIPVNGTSGVNPSGARGVIKLAKPALVPPSDPNADLKNLIYSGWLYALTADPAGSTNLYLTKDFGRNWTLVRLPNAGDSTDRTIPSNNGNLAPGTDIDVTTQFGNYAVTIEVDPNNPAIVYIGGARDLSALIRVDTTGMSDLHSYFVRSDNNDGGALAATTTSRPVALKDPLNPVIPFFPLPNEIYSPNIDTFLNLIQNPNTPFVVNATTYVHNVASFSNPGTDSRWVPWDRALQPDPYVGPLDPRFIPMNGVHDAFALRDPLTGKTRLIFGTNHGIATVLDAGTRAQILGSIGGVESNDSPSGNLRMVYGSRNGNLQIAQMYSGAAQPSELAAQIAYANSFGGFGFFYGMTQDNGFPSSDPDILNNGNLRWGAGLDWRGDGTDVVTDPNGASTVYQTAWFNYGLTDFLTVDGTSRTSGLFQSNEPGTNPDPTNWPSRPSFNMAVNPYSPDPVYKQMLISSQVGRVFLTNTQGREWFPVGEPSQLDGSNARALAFGAPDPNDPTGATNRFLYAGTVNGNIFVTFTGGGGGGGGGWINISNGDLAGNTAPVMRIVPNPTPGSREAYAVTSNGVYRNRDVNPASGETWRRINGNLFSLTHAPFSSDAFGNGNLGTETQLRDLHALVADWRYVIPDSFAVPNGPTHPILYVAGRGGVYRSIDDGATWSLFPDTDLNSAVRQGGYLPNAIVSDLDLSLGHINPATGRPIPTDPNTGEILSENLLVASTYGRGAFAIRLAPIVFPNVPGQPLRLFLAPDLPVGPPPGSDTGFFNNDLVTRENQPWVTGLSEQSAFGYRVRIDILDQTAGSPTFGQIIGTGFTDEFGRFKVQITRTPTPGDPDPVVPLFRTDGVKRIGVRATNESGTPGNIALLDITLDRTAPDKPGKPELTLASDTGISVVGDQITRLNNDLDFQVFVPANEPATTVIYLYRGAQIVGQRSGNGIIRDSSGPLADGVYQYRLRMTDLAGNESPFSDNYFVRIDTTAPARPLPPVLDPNNPPGGSDTGNPTDNITALRRPFFTGSAEPNTFPNPNSDPPFTQTNLIQLVDAAGNIIGSGPVQPNGVYSVRPDIDLIDNIYLFRVRVIDVAGNTSFSSDPIQVRILGTLPTTPTIALVAADDTGIVGDNITSKANPRFTGTAQVGLTVQLILTAGSIPGYMIGDVIAPGPGQDPVIVQADGTYLIQIPFNLADGTYRFKARVTNLAGGFRESADLSPPLQIVTPGGGGGALPAPTLEVEPADDSGIRDLTGTVVTSFRRVRFLARTTPGLRVDLINAATGQVLDPNKLVGIDGIARLTVPADLENGVIRLQARVRDLAGNQGPASNTVTLRVVSTFDDYDTDGRADLANYSPNLGNFSVIRSTLGLATANIPGDRGLDIPISADFDGDGRADIGVYRPQTAQWLVRRSRTPGTITTISFGAPLLPTDLAPKDLPVPADFDGDGRADYAIFRPSEGRWLVLLSGGGLLNRTLGQDGDIPIPGDYDGDFKDDFAVFRPSTAQWIIRPSSGGPDLTFTFGTAGLSVPVPGDYDGDYKWDLATYNTSTFQWQFRSSRTGSASSAIVFGNASAIPTPADFDGDGRIDFAYFQPTGPTPNWQIRQSSNNTTRSVNAGAVGDMAVPAPLRYRLRSLAPPPVGPGGMLGGLGTGTGTGGGGSTSAFLGSGSSSSSGGSGDSLGSQAAGAPAGSAPSSSPTPAKPASAYVPRRLAVPAGPTVQALLNGGRIQPARLASLERQYADRINLLLAFRQQASSPEARAAFDQVINQYRDLLDTVRRRRRGL